MDGVTILTKYTQSFMSGGTCLWLCVCAGIILVLSIIVCDTYCDGSFVGVFAAIGVIASIIMFIACIALFLSPSHTEYKITVDDTVSFTELTEHYQIVSQDGKLLTVKDLEEPE